MTVGSAGDAGSGIVLHTVSGAVAGGVSWTGGAGVSVTGGTGVSVTGGAGVSVTGGAGVSVTGGAGVGSATAGAGVVSLTGAVGVVSLGGVGVELVEDEEVPGFDDVGAGEALVVDFFDGDGEATEIEDDGFEAVGDAFLTVARVPEAAISASTRDGDLNAVGSTGSEEAR